eukprot:1208956-Amphidinium_carterae.1
MNAVLAQRKAPHCDLIYTCNSIQLKPSSAQENIWDGYMNGESDMGKWTMRICDFMVDHLGEWDLIVCNSDNLKWSFQEINGFIGVTAREMQSLQPPTYWVDQGCITGQLGHKLISGTPEELSWMQE